MSLCKWILSLTGFFLYLFLLYLYSAALINKMGFPTNDGSNSILLGCAIISWTVGSYYLDFMILRIKAPSHFYPGHQCSHLPGVQEAATRLYSHDLEVRLPLIIIFYHIFGICHNIKTWKYPFNTWMPNANIMVFSHGASRAHVWGVSKATPPPPHAGATFHKRLPMKRRALVPAWGAWFWTHLERVFEMHHGKIPLGVYM